MYPKNAVTLAMAVRPGDSLTATVTFKSSSSFVLTLANNTTNVSFQTTQSSRKARRNSVEWIMEGPSNVLSNFGTVPFSAASATISGKNGNLGSFTNANPITMVTSQGAVRAAPSSVTSGTSFSVTWKHS